MEKLTVDDVLLQTIVTLINLGARKAGLAEGTRGRPAAGQAGDRRRSRAAADRRGAPRRGAGAGQGRPVAAPDGLRAAVRRPGAARARGEAGRGRGRPGAAVRATLGAGAIAPIRAITCAPLQRRPGRAAASLCCFSDLQRGSLDRFPVRLRGRRRADLRGVRDRVRAADDTVAAGALARQRDHAGPVGSHPGGRVRVPPPPVHDDRHRRRRPLRRPLLRPGLVGGDRLRHRRCRVRFSRLHRHERVRALQRARGGVGARRHRAGARRRLPRRRRDRHARGRPGADRRGRLLRHPDPRRQVREGRRRRADRPRLRRLADLRLRPSGRRHLHQGRRRRSRHRRQDRGRHPRGRPAQPGRDRRQRGRQRGRLRRHGGRPLRDLRGHRRGGHAARRPDLRQRGGRDLPAGARRRLDHRVDHRHLRGQVEDGQRRARALPGHARGGRDRRAAVHPGDAVDDGRPDAARGRRRVPACGTSTCAR